MRFDILTIFPDFFGVPTAKSAAGTGIFGSGMLRRALSDGQVEAHVHNLRSFATDRHHTVDDRPFGGGEGMVLKPEPFAAALESIGVPSKAERDPSRTLVLLLSAQGRTFTQGVAHALARVERVVLLCGRYEGVDERVSTLLCDGEISIGDYVLTGGELGAAVIVDAVTRLVPGVLGNAASSAFESFGVADTLLADTHSPAASPRATHGAGGLLDYPQYTRPPEFAGSAVPEVLLNGNHEQVRRWRREKALEKTWRNRPDLLEQAELSPADRVFLASLAARQTA
ncbi:tRNA (guanosine(37)-N1)-methyltransferase TrmD [Acidipila sp. EB88]|uniref:tRNA (guanosine(37)-N1)-methyltransferase TrmD n=1 Tax=Acidipila sp. EB88 TaxID=2305226 RepID=UPI000F5D571F|nr:tRNA (guanosine(37)-N1)-methyltransferase TrmD [Acidipila sp. EB88]RRA47386.1 tRNA (guanosine(37)-N1)-methyltransferase TrmD [Acidipila sp. EB88]